ncbi:class I SAM-dependent methyltransferase [Oceanospirillaceae bacterium]|nr:class I SAM-dependent methyltransferase [bacterium]MDB4214342.1 class I SAM-dependent methyltransferase [Oceanospirillaceae bacterium]
MICYLCGLNNFFIRNGNVRDDERLNILECSDCGLVTLSSTEHIRQNHYENSGMWGKRLPSIKSWLSASEEDDERRFNMLKSYLTNKDVLDFGCGAGGFVRKADKLANNVVGIELEQRVHDYWENSFELHKNLDEINNKYDLVTAFHVIEHLMDPKQVLKDLSECIKPNGRIVIEVPNASDALLELYNNQAFQNFTYWSQHLYLFTTDTLARLSKEAGLQIVSIQQYQRYPLSNHLYWLSQSLPGGHEKWAFLDSPALKQAYSDALAAIGKCDTIIAYLEKE